MKKHFKYLAFLFTILALSILIFGCGTVKRDRQKSVDKTEIEINTVKSDSSKRAVIKESKVSTTTKETWISENSNVTVKPIDPTKPATVTREGNNITTTNAEVTVTENSETVSKTDSTKTSQYINDLWQNYLNSAINIDQDNDTKDLTLHKETSKPNPWLWGGIVAVILGALGLWLLYKRSGGD